MANKERLLARGRVPMDSDGVEYNAGNPLPTSATLDQTGLATSAKQDTAQTSLTAMAAVEGTTAGAAVVTDANGTLQQYLRGLIVLTLLQNTYLDGVETALAAATPAGTNHIGQVGSPVKNVQVTPVLDTNIYASGDVLFATTAVALALRTSGGCADLHSICVVDIDDQKPAMNLVFLRANTALGAFNAAPDIDDTEALDVIGIVPIVAGDYLDLGGVSVATLKNVGLTIDATTGTTVYVAAYLTAGTPTHTASGLKLNLGFLQA